MNRNPELTLPTQPELPVAPRRNSLMSDRATGRIETRVTKLSVIIATRNRAASLRVTLDRIFAQKFSGQYEYEIIVVNNASTDDTEEVIRTHPATRDGRLRYVLESRRGLSLARNAGLAVAAGEVIAFTDDDILVAENWLDEIYREFSADPELGLLGGRVLLAHPGLQPIAIVENEERLCIEGTDHLAFAIGANMVFRREVFEKVGNFDVRLGAGCFHAGSDDTDMIYRALRAGFRALYAPNVVVYHAHDRRTIEQAVSLEFNYGKGGGGFVMKHILEGDLHALRMMYWNIYHLLTSRRRAAAHSPELRQRVRANLRGYLIGLAATPLLLRRQ